MILENDIWVTADYDRLGEALLLARWMLRSAGVSLHRHFYTVFESNQTPSLPAPTNQTILSAYEAFADTMFGTFPQVTTGRAIPIYVRKNVIGVGTQPGTTTLGLAFGIDGDCEAPAIDGSEWGIILSIAAFCAQQVFTYPLATAVQVSSKQAVPPVAEFHNQNVALAPTDNAVAVAHTLVHELGHYFGLVHSNLATGLSDCTDFDSPVKFDLVCNEFSAAKNGGSTNAGQAVVDNMMFSLMSTSHAFVPTQVDVVKSHCSIHGSLVAAPP